MSGHRQVKVLYDEKAIADRTEALAREIAAAKPKDLLVVAILKGSFMFAADLLRALHRAGLEPQVEFFHLSSYREATVSSGTVKILRDIESSVRDRDVLLVDDILELLAHEKCRQQLKHCKRQQEGSISDQPRLATIADLILNAIPTTDPQTRSNRHRRSLKLWTKILSSIRENVEVALKKSTRSWPVPVRARFDHARTHHERNKLRWRTDPLSASSPGFNCSSHREIRDLSAVESVSDQKSGI